MAHETVPTARCGRSDEHGYHRFAPGARGWCVGNVNVIRAVEAEPRRPLPADATVEPPRIRVTFQASCAPCDYAGPGRASSLTALEDFDAHVAGEDHGRSEAKIAAAIADLTASQASALEFELGYRATDEAEE